MKIYMMMFCCVRSFVCVFICLLVGSFVCSFVGSFVRSFVCLIAFQVTDLYLSTFMAFKDGNGKLETAQPTCKVVCVSLSLYLYTCVRSEFESRLSHTLTHKISQISMLRCSIGASLLRWTRVADVTKRAMPQIYGVRFHHGRSFLAHVTFF